MALRPAVWFIRSIAANGWAGWVHSLKPPLVVGHLALDRPSCGCYCFGGMAVG